MFKSIQVVIIIFFISYLFGCSSSEHKYHPDRVLSDKQKDEVMHTIVRYIAKLPKKASDSTKFDSRYDEHYERQVQGHQFMGYHIAKDGEHFFLISRIAPSIHEMYVATGGRLRFDKNKNLIEYEEVFRTWKLPMEQLEERGLYLFDLMIKGEDLSPYYADKAGFNYIEFPDQNVYYSKENRKWESKIYGSVEEFIFSEKQ